MVLAMFIGRMQRTEDGKDNLVSLVTAKHGRTLLWS